jgi:hypothetical protein
MPCVSRQLRSFQPTIPIDLQFGTSVRLTTSGLLGPLVRRCTPKFHNDDPFSRSISTFFLLFRPTVDLQAAYTVLHGQLSTAKLCRRSRTLRNKELSYEIRVQSEPRSNLFHVDRMNCFLKGSSGGSRGRWGDRPPHGWGIFFFWGGVLAK